MADNRVVIKINYDNDKHRKALIDPKMVTVWHTRRILTVLGLLLLVIFGIFFWLTHDESELETSETPVAETPSQSVPTPPATSTQAEKPENKPLLPRDQSNTNKIAFVKRPQAIIFDRRVIRASINTAPRNNEPGDPVQSPVVIDKNLSFELFYFSQIKNLSGKDFSHKWYKDGNLAAKKHFTAKSNNERLISSKRLTVNDVGDWHVLLVDKKDKVLSEVNFTVNH